MKTDYDWIFAKLQKVFEKEKYKIFSVFFRKKSTNPENFNCYTLTFFVQIFYPKKNDGNGRCFDQPFSCFLSFSF